ncbi:hypothetical protein PGT21_029223 [Puccinia graminis f. sp. tritici]|uniref:Uncharacterized protein n=2 Tax=Puccinia graminis f. sp. tritici TaxID=56615 RepID=E3KRF6_PUCGT|nr:uncharacterized protein PGTG_12622 [Puccinia graminis f. sp. tritici CRL 75-36-700-3]EFP86881.2 hypothetical protein PGTG_12622 [Puccinia graminis f. sp. tritici CRL 75-36-700-3]KAA1101753.1 hypothetical protein PGT21_029223 [Puccinia graminis f. sp. tritici]KAA1136227.1 hypothetical protein PGTUg99_007333 [Puccinia graminis f. sp. tritici]
MTKREPLSQYTLNGQQRTARPLSLIDQHPSQPNIKSTLVSLLQESLALPALLLSIHSEPDKDMLSSSSLQFIISTPLDLKLVKQALDAGQLENWSSIDELFAVCRSSPAIPRFQ